MGECIREVCYNCEYLKVHKNEFDKVFVCFCLLHRKGVTVQDVTDIIPSIILNEIDLVRTENKRVG